ncbi:hypothetical protein CHLRE_01g037476v5 [Chlamydomonas reinhardtii]|uniref:RZ-type domain-containing protein n=1 Tax=Chlamydomonas reinhardtii TaxID=3055 RepID=A0A2K3E777_CHLRE|nr:uncharacterized protein CHLRE_01g037476v5 [Chlamydomonas reinhardtii]PNW88623.1 hypothetical protein CHLRE_01g037476v5 [Chlamydomonas reinhardtii]
MPHNNSSGSSGSGSSGSGSSGSGSSGGSSGGGSGAASDAAAQQEALLQRVLTALRSDPDYRRRSIYKCRNGHVYLVGGCTNPEERATCPACGASIGIGSGDRRVPGM